MENRIEKYVRPNILDLKPYISFRDTFDTSNYTKLDANENPFGDYNRYPDSTQKVLREKLSSMKNVPSTQIAVGNGSDELIDLIIKVFCRPNEDKIAVLKPSFAMYEFYASVNGNEVIELDLNADFELTKEEFLSKTKDSGAKVLFLCTPNNPTGNSISDLEFYIENFDGIVVIDEAYIEFSDKASMASKLNQFDNLIVLQTLSKAWGMAGLRIGMALASEFIISLFNRTKSPFNISAINIEKALIGLDQLETFETNLAYLKEQKELFYSQLSQIESVTKIYPSDANFFLIEFKNAEEIYTKLVENQILTSKRFPSIPNALRINLGTAEENQKLIQTLKTI